MTIDITTTTSTAGLGTFNQRHIDYAQDGTIWTTVLSGTDLKFFYAPDGDAAVESESSELSNISSASLFIDLDDNAIVSYVSSSDNKVYLIRGELNEAGTAFVWGTAVLAQNAQGLRPQHVVFSDPLNDGEQSGALIVEDVPASKTKLYYFSVDAEGTITIGNTRIVADSSSYASLDFHHTGDGKTLKDDLPHLFITWAVSDDGVYLSIGTYAAGSYSWSSDTLIHAKGIGVAAGDTDKNWFNVAFNGDNIVLGGFVKNTSGAGQVTTAVLVSFTTPSGTTTTWTDTTTTATTAIYGGNMVVDHKGNVYLVGWGQETTSDTSGLLVYRRFNVLTAELDDRVTVDSLNRLADYRSPTVQTLRYSHLNAEAEKAVAFAWSTRYVSPYEIKFVRAEDINTAPTAPTLTGEDVADSDEVVRRTWTFNDPDEGDAQTKYQYQWKLSTSDDWDYDSGIVISNANYIDLVAETLSTGTITERVRTFDVAEEAGEWAEGDFLASTKPDAPVIATPFEGDTIDTSTITLEWEDSAEYQISVFNDDDGDPGTTVLYTSTGTGASETFDTPGNGRYMHLGVRVKNDYDLYSDYSYVRVYVNYDVPNTPNITLDEDDHFITVSLTNLAGTIDYCDIYRREGSTGDGIRVATEVDGTTFIDWTVASGVEYEYKVEAVDDNAARAVSGWVS